MSTYKQFGFKYRHLFVGLAVVSLVFGIFVSCFRSASSDLIDVKLAQQLEDSRHLRRQTMKAFLEDAGMTRWYEKEVFKTRSLPLVANFETLRLVGPASMHIDSDLSISGNGSVRLDLPSSLERKNPSNRAYANPEIIFPLDGEDLREYNRFSVWIYVDAPGFYTAFAGFSLYNEGEKIMPTPGRFEGQHFENVYPGKWQRVVWEIPDLYRDRVTGFGVSILMPGPPMGASETMSLYVDDMRIETVEVENTRGFDLRKNMIAYSHSGYKIGTRKQAIVQNVKTDNFTLHNQSGKVVFSGKGEAQEDGFMILDFSNFNTPGFYTISIDGIKSKSFAIGDNAYMATAWRTLNFFYAQRCGYDQPGIHQECHLDVFCYHPDGRTLSVAGGWHDAADLTQGVSNTAESGIALLELAQSVQDKDKLLYERLLEEARWGLNWTMRTRFGDGYRNGGLVIGIWTQNIRGDKDDMQVGASKNAWYNFMGASYCAVAVPFYKDIDPVFARWCLNTAIEDFRFAEEVVEETFIARPDTETELAALAMVTAMRLYNATNERFYIDRAAYYASIVMACQQLERQTDWDVPLRGFFYESRARKRTLAYFHRSQEHLMVQGLAMLIAAAPDHEDASSWREACKAYSDYLYDTSKFMEPYGIVAAAVYEVDNTDYSSIYHEGSREFGAPSLEEYNAQVRNGIKLSDTHYLRRFPVAYQFRGFHAIHQAKAKSAFILARLFDDNKMRDIAIRQMEYIVGFNPFAASTIFGDGYDYHHLYGAFSGDVVGAVPVGIQTFENEDLPYWPMQSNCTYKEIWVHTTARMIWCIAELLK
jgi:hypothetical protein